MVMKKQERVVPAGEFKARCLAILDEVEAGGGEVIVTKRGRPVAKVVPLEPRAESEPVDNIDRTTPWPKDWPYPDLREYFTFIGDVVTPIDVEWEAMQ